MTKQTIAQLHGLDQTDPWDRRSDAQKARDVRRSAQRDTMVQDQDADLATFGDPPDDESLKIRAAPGMFYRLSVNCKLAALLLLETSLISIGVTARNTAAGCWVAVTSRRVGGQVVDRLRARGLTAELALVDCAGQPMTATLSAEEREAVHRGLIESTQPL
jgi:hypothetical protein